MIGRWMNVPPLTNSSQFRGLLVAVLTGGLGLLGGAGCSETTADADLPPLPPRVAAEGLPAPVEARPVREAIVVLTGEVRGEIEPCGCPTVPYGGFPRRSRALARLRAEGLPVFVLDAGEMLVKGLDASPSPDRASRARLVLDLANATGLDAWAPAPSDLAPGGLSLLAGTGAVSANWRSGGAPAFPAGRVVTHEGPHGSLTLGVLGLSDVPRPESGVVGDDPLTSLKAAQASLGAADGWVVLSNATLPVERAVAEGLPGLGAVLSVRGDTLDAPRSTAGAPILETSDRGRFLTVLRIALGAAPGPWTVVTQGPLETAAEERSRIAGLPEGPQRSAAEQTLAERASAVAAVASGRNLVFPSDRGLGTDLDGVSAVDQRIADWKGETLGAAVKRVAERASTPIYATAGACSGCHSDRFAAWLYTPHARAHEALDTRHAEGDVECVGCHTTGFGEPGGFAKLDGITMRTYKDVQCEACHGPMGGHPRDSAVKPRPVTRATCEKCHDPANSPDFDYERYLARISCTMISNGGSVPAGTAVGGGR